MKTKIQKGLITIFILIVGLFAFELFNYETSKIALDDIFISFGTIPIFGLELTLGSLLAIGAATIDIGGIMRIFTPQQGKNEPEWVQSAYTFWIIASLINATLTWWIVRLGLVNFRRIPPELVGHEFWIAVVIALFVWVIRFGLVRNLGTTGDQFIHITLPGRGKPNRPYNKRFPKPNLPRGINIPLQSPLPRKKEPPKKSRRKKKWKEEDFKKAVEENPRLKNMDQDKLAEIAGVSSRTIYRWINNLDEH